MASAEATGVAEALVKVLNVRHSLLSFRIQPLLLHLDTPDDGQTKRGGYGEGANFILVAKREVLIASSPSPSPTGAAGGGGGVVDTIDTTSQQGSVTPDGAVASAGSSRGGPSGSPTGVSAGVRRRGGPSANLPKAETMMRIAEVEELGRSPPFAILSTITIPPGSFAIPSNALVSDARRRGQNRKENAERFAIGSEGGARRSEPVVRIVLELVHAATGDTGGRGPSFFGRTKMSTMSKTPQDSGPVDRMVGGDARGGVVARAILDAAFLRRTIGGHRSITMLAPLSPSGGGDRRGETSSPETTEVSTKQGLSQRFGRLELAGHTVSARPGKPRLRLQVLECQNLCAADLFGKSDPCVLVYWCGIEVGRTSIARDNLNPSFSAPENIFQLPLMPPTAAIQHVSNRVAGRQRRSSLQRSQDWSAYAPELRLEVWDMDRDTFSRKWGKGELLGEVSLRGPCGIVPVIEASIAQALGLDVVAAGSVDATIRGVMLRLSAEGRVAKEMLANHASSQVFAGVISIKIAVDNATDDSEAWIARAGASSLAAAAAADSFRPMKEEGEAVRGSVPSEKTVSMLDLRDLAVSHSACLPHERPWFQQPHIRVRCLDARRLPLGCDGYCRIFWNGRQVGKTLLASAIARDFNNLANNNPGASSFQRNPVWWTSLTPLAIDGSNNGSLQSRSGSSSAAAVVPLYEEPTGDTLTLEVFDGIHLREKTSNGGEQAPVHDGLGRWLGSVTVVGERLISPPRGRMDLELSPSSPSDTSAGISLSISLERLSHEEEHLANGPHASPRGTNARPQETSASPRETNAAKQQEHDNNAVHTTTTTTSSTPATEEINHIQPEKGGLYQRPKLWLRLLLEGGRLLHGMDLSGTSDPYCQVYVDRVWYSKTSVCWGTLSPRWNQTFEIEISERGAPAGLGWDHEIRVELWDKDVVGADDFIGESNLFLHGRRDG